jgi:hypothetical protein
MHCTSAATGSICDGTDRQAEKVSQKGKRSACAGSLSRNKGMKHSVWNGEQNVIRQAAMEYFRIDCVRAHERRTLFIVYSYE